MSCFLRHIRSLSCTFPCATTLLPREDWTPCITTLSLLSSRRNCRAWVSWVGSVLGYVSSFLLALFLFLFHFVVEKIDHSVGRLTCRRIIQSRISRHSSFTRATPQTRYGTWQTRPTRQTRTRISSCGWVSSGVASTCRFPVRLSRRRAVGNQDLSLHSIRSDLVIVQANRAVIVIIVVCILED